MDGQAQTGGYSSPNASQGMVSIHQAIPFRCGVSRSSTQNPYHYARIFHSIGPVGTERGEM
jgi:hypothetical protein